MRIMTGLMACTVAAGVASAQEQELPLGIMAAPRMTVEKASHLFTEEVAEAPPGKLTVRMSFGVITSLATGVTSIMHTEKFTLDATLEVLRNQGVPNFTAAPTVYRSLRAHGVPAGRVSLVNASSAEEPLTPDVNEWAPNALGVEVHDHFGQTEAGILVNNHHHPNLKSPIKPGSMGRSLPGWQMTVVDPQTHEDLGPDQPGLLAGRLSESPFAWFDGYRSAPEKNTASLTPCGRWCLTGDLGQYDSEGSFRFSLRDDDVIIMAGYGVGRTDYAAHAYLRRIHYRDELPKTPSGKVQRFVLRQELHKVLEDAR